MTYSEIMDMKTAEDYIKLLAESCSGKTQEEALDNMRKVYGLIAIKKISDLIKDGDYNSTLIDEIFANKIISYATKQLKDKK